MDYLSVLNAEQKEAVCHEGSPLLILAGAGSGKTRVITTKIAWLISQCYVDPHSILAVTFTNKAAREMVERAEKLEPSASNVMIRTFHSFGAWVLRRYAEAVGLNSQFTIYDDDDVVTLLTKAISGLSKNQAKGYAKKIARAKDYCLKPDDIVLQEIDSDPLFVDIYRKYQKRLQETGNVDFGDLIMLPVQLLLNFPDIRERLQKRFSVIMVDEYQDSNIAQFELLKAMTGSSTYICAVGDDDQSIYKFRGAEVQNILTFPDSFPNTKIIKLERNYRSVEPILKTADSIVRHNKGRLGKTLISDRGSGEKPQIFILPNQDAEAELCAQLITAAVESGGKYSDWAILYRTNAQSLNFETDFLHKKIPYKVIGTLKFYEREEIKDTLAVLALILNGRDEIAFRRIINKPPRGIGEVTQSKLIELVRKSLFENSEGGFEFENNGSLITAASEMLNALKLSKKAKQGVEEFLALIKKLREIIEVPECSSKTALSEYALSTCPIKGDGLARFIFYVINLSGLYEYHKNQDEVMETQKIANLHELANTASVYDFSLQGLTDFLEHIELDRSLQEENTAFDAVSLITIHNTKGLEFKNVIITGLETGIFPRNENDFEELEEERRLMYVACTRAMNGLYMTSCSSRRMYGTLSYMQPSKFLYEIDSSLVETFGIKNGQVIHMNGFDAKHFELRNENKSMEENPYAKKWKRGARLFHDEYGYGVITKSDTSKGELVITVQFETGTLKCFMPEYQSSDMVIIKD